MVCECSTYWNLTHNYGLVCTLYIHIYAVSPDLRIDLSYSTLNSIVPGPALYTRKERKEKKKRKKEKEHARRMP